VATSDREEIPIEVEADVVSVRRSVRKLALGLRFSLIEQTKLVTAASELARNALEHGGGGRVVLSILQNGSRSGVELVFEDRGPGIDDPEAALRDGFSTGQGLGLGLGGARRLVHEFELSPASEGGTRVRVVRWK
jgi:serine/threonine-protein kinase RsbT